MGEWWRTAASTEKLTSRHPIGLNLSDDEDDNNTVTHGGSAAIEEDGGDSQTSTVVETATAAANFATLLGAPDVTLIDALEGECPFRVFAPNDAAFEAFEATDARDSQ